ncbi:2-hydroxyacyl-CoA dehydratase family protein [Alteromonas lipolytica]|uniref:2-hydroxyglutaryl-CoA dehydratase n=1 Tax=Alteromonas lipolytica TaxID=1856405 RepID=A0A1E8FC76_9ALTE|nr:2-hydroxyacyl-CoA dehydratase family protein [Alteromonas lipolytica]OFI33499.1 hypothetical protein BFC17_04370 [Alteromonas lipolytica]GGF59113.1 hypothetical protein GCM10011338_09250 [Alteromonas lipolytica]
MKQERLASVDAIRTLRRAQVAASRDAALAGAPFALVHSDEAEEIFALMGIDVQVYNPWNFIIVSEGKAPHFNQVLNDHGYPGQHFFAFGYASTLAPEQAPWGGLPKPAIVIGSTREDLELRVTELWAREYGCEYFPLDFNFASAAKKYPGANWWLNIRENWPDMVDSDRLELRVSQLKELIKRLEKLSGKTFDESALAALLERINVQMDAWGEVCDLIGSAPDCPVSFRDQLACYQMMWSRGTEESLRSIEAYRDEVKARVENAVGAYGPVKKRIFYASMESDPRFHEHLRVQHSSAIVGGPYTTCPDLYARTIYGDSLKTLAARNLLLFAIYDTDWWIAQAQRLRADIMIAIEPPNKYPSMLELACNRAGIPFLSLPSSAASDKNLSKIDTFFNALD